MDSGTVNHFSSPRNAVGKGGLSARICWQLLNISVKEGGEHERWGGRGTPTINAEEEDQLNWRALKTGDTASCAGTGLESNLCRTGQTALIAVMESERCLFWTPFT